MASHSHKGSRHRYKRKERDRRKNSHHHHHHRHRHHKKHKRHHQHHQHREGKGESDAVVELDEGTLRQVLHSFDADVLSLDSSSDGDFSSGKESSQASARERDGDGVGEERLRTSPNLTVTTHEIGQSRLVIAFARDALSRNSAGEESVEETSDHLQPQQEEKDITIAITTASLPGEEPDHSTTDGAHNRLKWSTLYQAASSGCSVAANASETGIELNNDGDHKPDATIGCCHDDTCRGSPASVTSGCSKDDQRKSRSQSGSHSRSRSRSPNQSYSQEKHGQDHKQYSKRESHSRDRNLFHKTYSRHKSRHHDRDRKQHRSRRRTRSHSRDRNSSHSRDRDHSHSRNRYHFRSRHRDRSRSRHRDRSRNRHRDRSHSTDRGQHYSRERDRYHSKYRNRHSRDRDRYHSRDRYRYRDHYYSRNGRHSRRRDSSSSSTSQSHSRSRDASRERRRQSYSRSKERSGRGYFHESDSLTDSNNSTNGDRNQGQTEDSHHKILSKKDLVEEATLTPTDGKQEKIAQLTEFCRQLAEGKEGETAVEQPVVHPFAVCQQPLLLCHDSSWKTPSQMVLERNTASAEGKEVIDLYPVSSGLEHQRENEDLAVTGSAVSESLPIGELMAQRLQAQNQFFLNPLDPQARAALDNAENQLGQWCKNQLKPGQFTGQSELRPLTKADHQKGIQAWARKNMFAGLAPVMSGFGLKMLKKMGWQEGMALGRAGVGLVEPIELSVKVDRQGLATQHDHQPPVVPAAPLQVSGKSMPACLQGKHPVSALQELCTRKHWGPPLYELVNSSGKSHKMTFLFQVTIPPGTFRPSCGSNSKKMAKAQAAIACLTSLGLMTLSEAVQTPFTTLPTQVSS